MRKQLSPAPTLARALLAASAVFAALPAAADVVTISVAGYESHDLMGAVSNQSLAVQLPAGAYITGLAWSVGVTAFDPSWLADLALGFTNSLGQGFAFSPADGLNQAGSTPSSGFIDLVNSGVGLRLQGDGVLNLEFFETFDDLPGAADGRWDSGSISLTYTAAVPEPGSLLLAALGLGAMAARPGGRRRREPARPA